MKTKSTRLALISLAMLAPWAGPAQAERADRDKPIQLEAQRSTVDDAKKVQVLEGDVLLTQGTLTIRSDKIVITEDNLGFQMGVATGGKNGLAHFRQKREGKDEYIEGEAERIEYNTRDEVAELFRRAWVQSGHPKSAKGTTPQRVRAVIQPKKKDGATPAETSDKKSEPLQLKGSKDLIE